MGSAFIVGLLFEVIRSSNLLSNHVTISPWPILTYFGLLFLTSGLVGYLHLYLYGATCILIEFTLVYLPILL